MSFDFWTNYNLALHGNYCVSNWFSLPFAYKRKWEREGKALTLRAPARILRTECGNSVRSTVTLRAGAQLNVKSAKEVWGKTRVFPHKQHIKSSRDYPPKQSGGLFRKNITHLNYSLPPNIITIAISSIYMIHKFVPRYYRCLYKIINFT